MMFSVDNIRRDFPILKRRIHNKKIVYLDSAATSLKPQSVVDALNDYYTHCTANVFRGIYSLSEEATAKFEGARALVAQFIHAQTDEIVFTRNTSESLNLLAYSWGEKHITKNDKIVSTLMEHHSNFVTWQQLALRKKSRFIVVPIKQTGEIEVDKLNKYITPDTKVFAFTAVSNMLGTINPVIDIVKAVRKISPSCLIVVDAAQAVPHMPVDVEKWGADFVAFSSHKMLGPTGVGVLWGKKTLLESMDPFLYGGDMIREVHVDHTVFNTVPHKFEAGTPHIAGVIGLGAAVSYLAHLGMENVRAHELAITTYALESLKSLDGVIVYGPKDARKRGGVVAFSLKGVHPHDIAQVLDEDNVCVRSGHHCAMPVHDFFHIPASARMSFSVYTSKDDIDALIEGLRKAKKRFT